MVVVSGVILTFLSINNITNLRILTEKRIQETQLQIAGQISAQFQEKLNGLAEEFSKTVLSGTAGFDSLARSTPKIRPFLISKEKEFLYPFFIESGQQKAKTVTNISAEFMNGETDEFQKENPKNAMVHFLSALSKSRTSGDSTKVVNALGRVSVKMKQPEQAFHWYRLALDDFSRELNLSGIPYSYLAISQLIKLVLPARQNEIAGLSEKFIEQLAENEIPLTPGTQTILDDLSGWLSTVQLQESQQKNVSALIENINSKLGFISGYGNEIREITSTGRKSEFPAISGKYPVFAMTETEKPELLVMSAESELPSGFVVSLNDLWIDVTSHLPEAKDFKYTVELVSGNNIPLNPDKLSVRAELSPYFPLHRITIRPANEELVEKFVRKRSWTYGIALVLLLGGMSLGIVLILRDISREKRMADMQSEFVAHVTHELKTPLTSISMFAETIFLDRAKSEEIRKKYANIIMKESVVLKRKIDNILEYAVRKSESSKYRMKETNLTLLMEEVMDEMKYWLDINQFKVKIELETDIFAQVDPEAIKQAITNLIGNAIKYSPVDKNLIVRLKKKADKILIEVEDTGMGIPSDQLNLIFEKFYRIRSQENESTTGTGLGLCVTRDIVKAHKGEISVESEIDKGSKFSIWLNS
jgi:signal transduction histidine kinase